MQKLLRYLPAILIFLLLAVVLFQVAGHVRSSHKDYDRRVICANSVCIDVECELYVQRVLMTLELDSRSGRITITPTKKTCDVR